MLTEAEVMDRLKDVKILIADVDGVLTDGKIFLFSDGTDGKQFNAKDEMATKLLLRKGIDVAYITGSGSETVPMRARELGVTKVYRGVKRKLPVFERLLEENGLKPEQCAYVGDDLTDLPIMVRVGVAVAVRDAHSEVRKRAHFITERNGGDGAFREVIDLLLKAKGLWDEVIEFYTE